MKSFKESSHLKGSQISLGVLRGPKMQPKIYTLPEYIEKINSLFPLPPKPDEMCYDEFIKLLLSPYVLEKKVEVHSSLDKVKSSSSEVDSETAFRAKMYKTNVAPRSRGTEGRSTVRASILTEKQRDSALLMKEKFQVRFGNLISDFRNVCIIYQLLQLQEILNVMREFPPAGTNPNDTIFVWSYKNNLKRFEQQMTTVYVDILEKNKSDATLDDLKFYVDLGELINLVQALLNDIVEDRDICEENAFMDLLRDTQVDIDKVIGVPYETIMAQHDALREENSKKKIIGIQNPQLVAKQRSLKKERNQIDYLSPIETRYKVNWAYDNVEQGQHKDFLRCKVLTDELEKLAELKAKDEKVWMSCQVKYVTLIEQYKTRINTVQETFDEDMEAAENMLQATTNRVTKCKEDLKAQMDMVEMFHRKIKEVRDKIAMEEERERARLSAARPSKRPSRVLARQKAEAKEAKKQEKLNLIKAKKEAKAQAKALAKQEALERAKEEANDED
ncbi:reticulocyte-binding protein homolog 2a [Drosophila kikkawai]|uniref:Reticulocyte-binding protein homolog 2a n=1 Tax=Drosophila kikkawai TaxID=30033 RepID=A0A6P4IFW2_DROKI|nr:uncharacterized protein LOC108074847 [Drosophila kikkawai]